MIDSTKFELEGSDAILDALDALEPRLLLAIIKAAERKSLMENVIRPVRGEIAYSADSKRAIRIVNDRQDRTGFFAGVTSDAFWLRFVEKGTKNRTTKKGFNRGSISPKPQIIPSILNTPDDVVEFFNKDFGQAVEAILQKRLKKLNK